MTGERSFAVLIVGAGLTGLACAARLRQLGVERFSVLEQGDAVGAFWRGNYERIRLHSPFHDLPDDGGLRRRWGMFLGRDDLLDYLDGYARHHGLGEHLRFGERVGAVRRGGEGWEVEATSGRFTSRFLAIATAGNREPVLPDLAGADAFTGRQLHTRAYRNAEPFAGDRVLVIGSGNSAAEVALDLVEGGARSVSLWVRAPRHVISLPKLARMARAVRLLRVAFTPKKLLEGHQYTRVHPDWLEQVAQRDGLFARFGMDLSRHGVRRPEEGPATQMYVHNRVPWYDQGTAAAIDAGRIEVIDGNVHPIEGVTEKGVRFAGREESYDTLIYGTGFQPLLEEFVEDVDGLLEWRGNQGSRMPRTDGRSRSSVDASLFFPGFDLTVNGGLSLGLWGFEVAEAIHQDL